jgi:hypothetical protein
MVEWGMKGAGSHGGCGALPPDPSAHNYFFVKFSFLKSEYHASDSLGAWLPRKSLTLEIFIRDMQDLIFIGSYLSESH